MKILIWGHTGFLGSRLLPLLESDSNLEIIKAKSRLENYADVIEELISCKPDKVINVAGLTGRPNVDWCEDHKVETLQVNTIGASVLGDYCHRQGIHLVYVGTGCIYEYDEEHQMPEMGAKIKPFTEEDEPNFTDSFYARSKILTEKILKEYDNVLILRVRMPISDDFSPRSFITKIKNYEKVVNIPNSMTILTDLLPVMKQMTLDGKTGIYNFTNPGILSHNMILDLYKKYIDPDFTYQNFSLDEQAKILKAGRSNNFLDSDKLTSEYPVPSAASSIHEVFKRIKSNTEN